MAGGDPLGPALPGSVAPPAEVSGEPTGRAFGTPVPWAVVPLALLVPAGFALLGPALGFRLSPGLMLAGAAGWAVALALRLPAFGLLRLVFAERAQAGVPWLSGPAEELTRLAAVLLLVGSADDAYSLGLGWATIEVVYGLVQMVTVAKLATRSDEAAMRARALIEEQGMGAILERRSALWDPLERASATALHIALTVLLFLAGWLVLMTAPLHSAVNVLAVRTMRRSLALTEAVLAAIAMPLLAVALYLV